MGTVMAGGWLPSSVWSLSLKVSSSLHQTCLRRPSLGCSFWDPTFIVKDWIVFGVITFKVKVT